ncbi:effector-associated constant component EACC1 [Bailinhaonella thermotolerans]|uniref:Uncharacterized protein n=1 Tax=Bailinhaonella thermotolerans TaxID=1070861 RepID=A0A3A4AYX2_9ACTN|nr:hypothetical protein [Bailinhaonella thermotolerans]RJL34323.1 hypothetical protein D5H75_07700 [Bailinhaonella thermotolerans]
MRVTIGVHAGEDGRGAGDAAWEELVSLGDWLRDEPELRGRVDLAHVPPPPDRMGAGPHALAVVLEDERQRAGLARSLEIWLRQRGPDVKIMVRVGDRVAEIAGHGDVDVAALLREALRAAGERR